MALLDRSRELKQDACTFLEALTAILKPRLVVECGTYPGTSTAAILRGLGDGRLVTYERDARLAAELSIEDPRVELVVGPPGTFAGVDFAVIDSGPTYDDRVRDVKLWWDTAPPWSIALVDDTAEPWFSPWRGLGVELPTEMGVALWRKI